MATQTQTCQVNIETIHCVDSDGDGTLGDTETITYDAIGNPTTYLGAELSWNARQLENYKDETNNISYTYDSDGLRASKTVNGAKTIYQYVNSALYYQCTYTTSGAIDKELYFFYDSYGNLASIRCFTGGNEYVYYTATNTQGDVLGIYDSSGTNVASYEYDTWGNIISTTDTSPIGIAELNPIRYRGYYYDSETELYYLQSRYYDSQIGRFLNADILVSNYPNILSYNLYTYCGNNSEKNTDPTGTCYYNARGVWCHDNWESLNGYKKKAEPIDLTEKLDNFMETNALDLKEYQKNNGTVKAAKYFYNNVKDGGPQDIKLQEEWNLREEQLYLYNDQILRFDDPGNISYGYVGAVIFHEGTLCFAAGMNQVEKYQFQFGDLTTWYDDPRDNAMIKYGYELYMKGAQ